MDRIEGRERMLLTRHRNRPLMDPRALRRAVRSGELMRLRSGAYVRTAVWAGLEEDDRRRLEVAAAIDAGGEGLTVTSRSAAAVLGLPVLGRPDGLVHVRTSVAAGTRTEHGFRKHATVDQDLHVTVHAGIQVTTVERTVIDLAMQEPFASAVVAADWALRHRTTKDALRATLDELAPKQGRSRVRHVIEFADGRSGSPGESWSRVRMDEAGLEMPELQVPFHDAGGLIGVVDFFWPQFGLIGEFDGLGELTDPRLLGDRTTRQALAQEKRREDRLRNSARRPAVTRWLWEVLPPAGALAGQLLAAGVRRR